MGTGCTEHRETTKLATRLRREQALAATVATAVFPGRHALVALEVAADAIRAVESKVKGDLGDGPVGLQQEAADALDAGPGDLPVYGVSQYLQESSVEMTA